jgi:hypothetical protein
MIVQEKVTPWKREKNSCTYYTSATPFIFIAPNGSPVLSRPLPYYVSHISDFCLFFSSTEPQAE